MGISKSDYMNAVQCERMLWLNKNRPEEKIIPPEVMERLDKGNEFGDSAMGMFGPFTEVTSYKPDGGLDYKKMIDLTKECIEDYTPVICEASFSYYGNYCAVDILKRSETGFEIYEVKNSDQLKEQFVRDTGFQKFILTKLGLKIIRCCVVLPDKSGKDEYEINDVTAEAEKYAKEVSEKIWDFNKIKNSKEEILRDVGPQCTKPYRCFFYDYCHKSAGEKDNT